MDESDLEQEQILFYEKVAGYVSRHPEFVDELQRRMAEEERNYSGKENEQKKDETPLKGLFRLDERKINDISKELSGLLFNRDGSNKSVLETTVQDAFSNIVKNYLTKYAD